jgi:pilus assembly protein CpaF
VKSHIHRRLLERLNLANLDRLDRDAVVETIRGLVRELLAAESIPLNVEERENLIMQVLDEIFGLGPLQPLMEDPTVADILVNTADTIYVERNGRLELTDVRFQSDRHLLQVIDRIVSSVGRRIDDTSPHGGRPTPGRIPGERHCSAPFH